MADRIPIYELHIRPLFRLLDQQHMFLFFDLWDYDAVKANAAIIAQRLRTSMPPESTGGPWPPELVALFERWIACGFPRLQMGRGTNFQLTKDGTSYHLECTVEIPNDSAHAWLDIADISPSNRTYRLYVDQGAGGQQAPTTIGVSDDFDEPATISAVRVIDVAGINTVARSSDSG